MPDVKVLANGNVLVSIPIILRESAGRKRIITDVARTIRLSMLSPEIIHRVICGTLPPDISLAKLYKLPDRWDEQLKQLGIAVE